MAAAILLMLAAAAPAAAVAPAAPASIQAPVLARTVERGEKLAAGDFTRGPISPSAARGMLAPAEAAGQEATHRIMAGAPVRAADVAQPRVVRRGEAVTISFITGALTITSAGRAMSDAARGEPVRVFNTATGRTLDGVADAPGQVSIPAR
ncbi:flagellar basal body P-ring formation chaperone FlgA [Novosphingobium sp. BL-8H]|uniref:flagellar basal body P-ring formation chaperone FlgA n=1 Tax=Novosphingobium sp. BL-8H TaxID=3127640 RepID=UPI003756582E